MTGHLPRDRNQTNRPQFFCAVCAYGDSTQHAAHSTQHAHAAPHRHTGPWPPLAFVYSPPPTRCRACCRWLNDHRGGGGGGEMRRACGAVSTPSSFYFFDPLPRPALLLSSQPALPRGRARAHEQSHRLFYTCAASPPCCCCCCRASDAHTHYVPSLLYMMMPSPARRGARRARH